MEQPSPSVDVSSILSSFLPPMPGSVQAARPSIALEKRNQTKDGYVIVRDPSSSNSPSFNPSFSSNSSLNHGFNINPSLSSNLNTSPTLTVNPSNNANKPMISGSATPTSQSRSSPIAEAKITPDRILNRSGTKDTLKQIYGHPRDDRIVFVEKGHFYYISILPIDQNFQGEEAPTGAETYMSVTTWNSTFFKKFDPSSVIKKMKSSKNFNEGNKYWGMSDEAIQNQWKNTGETASTFGTGMHDQIETFLNTSHSELGRAELTRAQSPVIGLTLSSGSLSNASGSLSNSASLSNASGSLSNGSLSNGTGGTRKDGLVSEMKEITQLDLLTEYVRRVMGGMTIDQSNVLMTVEWAGFLNYLQDLPTLIPFRTEWRIFHEELQLAGSIDIIYRDPSVPNGLILADWKRSKEIKTQNNFRERGLHWAISHLHDCNYWKYSLQLNTYKYILENKYGYVITRMFLVQIHPDLDKETCPRGYKLWEVADLQKEVTQLAVSRMVEIKATQQTPK